MYKISVIVPAYNTEQYIGETFDSLLSQTLEDIEIVVVNDGSTDNTQSVIDSYCEKYSNIKSVVQENGGVSSARNRGLEEASGEFVFFLDSDDTVTKSTLEAYYTVLNEHSADLAIGRVKRVGGGIVSFNEYADKIASRETLDLFDKNILWSFLVSNKCYRRESLINSGVRFKQLSYAEDALFFVEYLMIAKPKLVGAYGACLCYLRREDGEEKQATQSATVRMVSSFFESSDMVYEILKKAAYESLSKEEADDYMQEMIYKTVFTMMFQFYRLIWSAEDEAIEILEKEFNKLYPLLSEDNLRLFDEFNCDIGMPVFNKKELAEKPIVSVIIKKMKNESFINTFNSVFKQSMPHFEVFIPKSCEALIPRKWQGLPNIKILDDADYKKNAKSQIKGKYMLYLNYPIQMDERILRYILRMKNIPEFILKAFMRSMVYVATHHLSV